MDNNLPITNNNQLPFLSQIPKQKPLGRNVYLEKQKSFICSHDVNEQNNKSIKTHIYKTLATNYLYCVIIGCISFISGVLLSVIAFHGLNSNTITPIMGKCIIMKRMLKLRPKE